MGAPEDARSGLATHHAPRGLRRSRLCRGRAAIDHRASATLQVCVRFRRAQDWNRSTRLAGRPDVDAVVVHVARSERELGRASANSGLPAPSATGNTDSGNSSTSPPRVARGRASCWRRRNCRGRLDPWCDRSRRVVGPRRRPSPTKTSVSQSIGRHGATAIAWRPLRSGATASAALRRSCPAHPTPPRASAPASRAMRQQPRSSPVPVGSHVGPNRAQAEPPGGCFRIDPKPFRCSARDASHS